MVAVLGLFAGCTAIIDGADNLPENGTSMADGSQPRAAIAEGASAGRLGASRGDGGDGGTRAEQSPPADVGGEPGSSAAEAASDGGVGGQPEASGGVANGGAQSVVPAAGAGGEGGAALAAGGASGTETADGAAGSTSSAGSTSAGGGTGGPLPVGEAAHGHQLLALSNCYRCHGDNLAGRSFYRNITPDRETGIGSWTDKQIADAVRGAIGPTGELFCASMPLYSGFKDQDIADVIAYLRLIPAVTNKITSVCPGHNP